MSSRSLVSGTPGGHVNANVPEEQRETSSESDASSPSEHRWTFLSNHTHVLLCLAIDAEQRVRDVARKVGLTERAVQRILSDLVDAGTITRERVGRRNRYTLELDSPLRHPLEAHNTVGELLEILLPPKEARDAS